MKTYFDKYSFIRYDPYKSSVVSFNNLDIYSKEITITDFDKPLGILYTIDSIFRDNYIMELRVTMRDPTFFGGYKVSVIVEFLGKKKIGEINNLN